MIFSNHEIDALFLNKFKPKPKLVVPSITPEHEMSTVINEPVPPDFVDSVFELVDLFEPAELPKPMDHFNPPKPSKLLKPVKQKPFNAELRREKNRISAKKFRDRQQARLKELKFRLYGNEDVLLPFEISRIVLPPEIPRRERAVMFSSITRKRRKLTLDFLESALAAKGSA